MPDCDSAENVNSAIARFHAKKPKDVKYDLKDVSEKEKVKASWHSSESRR